MSDLRVGIGVDAHALSEGVPLVLAGVEFRGEPGLVGHSDGDVISHALIDALLGAAGLGDIGELFPPGTPAWHGASSISLLQHTCQVVRGAGFELVNADCVLVGERPRIAPVRAEMRARLAGAMGTEPDRVTVRATTTDGLGFTGRGEGLAAHARRASSSCVAVGSPCGPGFVAGPGSWRSRSSPGRSDASSSPSSPSTSCRVALARPGSSSSPTRPPISGEYLHASYEGDVETVVRNGHFWAIPSFAFAVLALVLALLPSRVSWVAAVVVSVLGVLTLLALFQGTSTPFHPPFPDRRYGLWLAILLLLGGGTALGFWLSEPASYRVSDSRLPDWLRDP